MIETFDDRALERDAFALAHDTRSSSLFFRVIHAFG
jgi:hypothetical protein